jgi:hypothetical protein
LFARSNNPSDSLAHWDVRSDYTGNSGQDAVRRRFHFHHRFVGFDFEKRLAFGDALAFLLSPSDELAGFLRHLESGHHYAEGHNIFLRNAD